MLVIFTSRHDAGARSLAERWASHGAALLTCEDLSVAGWRHSLPPSPGATAVVSGQRVETGDVAGVLIRWPCVLARELGHIAPEDREYVASEMTAFLRSWLTGLACPVLNRPSAGNLMGPTWRPEQWVHAALGAGIRARPVRRHAVFAPGAPAPATSEEHATVTVIGERCFGEADPALKVQARRLAAAVGVALLDVHFSGPGPEAELISADLLATVDDEQRADAVLDCLFQDRRGHGRTESRS